MILGYLLDSSNVSIKASEWLGPGLTPSSISTMDGLPLGSVNGDGSGEIALKVVMVGNTIGTTFVAGSQTDNNALSGHETLPVGGKGVVTSTYAPAYTADDATMLAIDDLTGKLLVDASLGSSKGLGTQVTSTAASATALAARTNRKRATFNNLDVANAVWINTGAATNAAGFRLDAGKSYTFYTNEALQIIDNGSHATVCIWEEWG